MCAKINEVVSHLVPECGPKRALREWRYRHVYNRRHAAENGFEVFFRQGVYEYVFPNGIRVRSYDKFIHAYRCQLPGYWQAYHPQPGDTIVDAGAYLGDFTIYAAQAVGLRGRVLAFEPDPAIRSRLCSNIALNALDNVVVVSKGLWRESGTHEFYADDGQGGGTLQKTSAPQRKTTIEVADLDTELARMNIGRVDFIKADVEGAELEMLQGMRNTIVQWHPRLAIASYHIVQGEPTAGRIEQALRSHGYRATTGFPVHPTTYGEWSGPPFTRVAAD